MTTKRRVLVLTSDDEPVTEVEDSLTAAGHQVRRCVASRSPSFPCAGLVAGETCPLDDGLVDVVVDVRQHPWPRPMPRESGVVCALRDGIPLVVAGRTAFHPYDGWAEVTLDGVDGIVHACEQAIDASLTRHRDAAREAAEAVVTGHGRPRRQVQVFVGRGNGEVHARIDGSVPAELRGVVAARAGAALRRIDRTARRIEVGIRP